MRVPAFSSARNLAPAADETRKQVQHHHARFLDVGLKEIALHEFDAIGDAFALAPVLAKSTSSVWSSTPTPRAPKRLAA